MIEPGNLIQLLKDRGFVAFCGVPDSMFKGLIEEVLMTDELSYLPAVREDIAVGIAVGTYFAGQKAVIFMENSGLGVCLDSLVSLAIVYKIPLLLLVAWAGYEGDDVEHHNVMGLATCRLLDVFNIPYISLPSESIEVEGALDVCMRRMEKEAIPQAILFKPGVLA